MLATPEQGYFTDEGFFVGNPAGQMIVGGPDPEFSPTLFHGEVTGGRFLADSDTGPVDLPARPGLFTFDGGTTTTPFGPIAGFGLFDPAVSFLAYVGEQLDDPDHVVFAIAGEPTLNGGNIPSSRVLTKYDLFTDIDLSNGPVLETGIPFVHPLIDAEFSDPGLSGYLILRKESGGVSDPPTADNDFDRSRTLFAAWAIEGTGAEQKSLMLVTDGALLDANGKASISQGMRGSARLGSHERPIRLAAGTGSIPDGEGNHFFGPDLDYFALTNNGLLLFDNDPNDLDLASGFTVPFDSPATLHGFVHLARKDPEADRLPGPRTSQTLQGYAAGMGETRLIGAQGPVFPEPYAVRSHHPSGVQVFTNPNTNSVAANFFLESASDNTDVAAIAPTFGASQGTNFRGAYIDDRTFGMRNAQNRPGFLATEEGDLIRGQSDGFNADGFRSAMFTANLVPLPDIAPPGVELCSRCEFMTWGPWSSEFRWGEQEGPNNMRLDRFHAGSWIAAELPGMSEIPETGIASYGGHMLGNVYNQRAQYIAVGGYRQTYDFATRSGAVDITSFDERDYAGSVAGTSDPRNFVGSFQSADRHGVLSGSFTRPIDPVDRLPRGVMGSGAIFDSETDGAHYRASFTFGAGKIPAN